MIRKLVATLGVALAVMLSSATLASAAPYPAPAPPLSVSNTAVEPGGFVTISGSGYIPGEPINITVTVTPFASGLRGIGALGLADFSISTTADGGGNFTAQVPMGAVSGMASIVAVGTISGVTTSAMVSVGTPGDTVPTGGTPAVPSNPAYPAPTDGATPPAAPPAAPNDNVAGGLPDTGAGINIAAMIAVGAGVVLAGFALAVFGARGAFGRRSGAAAHS